MSDERSGESSSTRHWPQRVRVRPIAWVPGELLAGFEVDIPAGSDATVLLAALQKRIHDIVGSELVSEQPTRDEAPLLLPTTRSDKEHLLFLPVVLKAAESRAMRVAVERLNEAPRESFGTGVTLVAATPNWFGAAQDCCGGSPASQPMPAEPFGDRVRYAPQLDGLDLVRGAEELARQSPRVDVAILDTAPDPVDLSWADENFPHNRHLHETLRHLTAPVGRLQDPQFEAARQQALVRLEQNGGFRPIEPPETYDIRDHGIFVAGIVHATAPWVRMRLVRVLNNFGVGSLRSLLVALVDLIRAKGADDRLIINLSLGMLPAVEQLASIWFGLPVDGLPGCPEDVSLQFLASRPNVTATDLRKLIDAHDGSISDAIGRLHAPIERLAQILQAHNCLVVAAAGNDSVYRGVERNPRWNPRIPARYDTVLGVAADTIRPLVPARYSNRGELAAEPVRDAISTLGGELGADGLSPQSGLISIYTAEQFPKALPPAPPRLNETGWAEWSGTSFATPIMSGIAANLWRTRSNQSAAQILAEINTAARAGGRPDTGDLGVPGIPVRLTWLS